MAELNIKFSGLVRVFVYGTLKPGEAKYEEYCAGKVLHAQPATARGQLFALPTGYPAMTPGDSLVQGYLLCFADSEIFSGLDEWEDYQPQRPMSENLYNRLEIEVFDLQGISLTWAWVYLMTPDIVSKIGGVRQPDGWWSGCGLKPSKLELSTTHTD